MRVLIRIFYSFVPSIRIKSTLCFNCICCDVYKRQPAGFAYFPGINLDYKIGWVYMGGVQMEQPLYMGGKIRAAYKMSLLGKDCLLYTSLESNVNWKGICRLNINLCLLLIHCKINTNRKLLSYISTRKYTNRTIYHSYQPFLSSCFEITLHQKTNCTKIIVVWNEFILF